MFQNNFEILNVFGNKELEVINKNNDCIAPLNVSGSINCQKSIKIGFSDKPIEGSLIYDGSNFLGFNKDGWNLLSVNKNYLKIEEDKYFFDDNRYLNLIIDLEDDHLFKFNVDLNIDEKIIIQLNKTDFNKINHYSILLKNKNNQHYKIEFLSKQEYPIFYENGMNNIELDKIILIDIIFEDDEFIIHYKKFS